MANSHRMPLEELQIGDIVLIRPGEAIPLDSVIIEGESSLDESSLTGESIPVTKRPGDQVFAGTINQTGGLSVRVSRLARDSTIAKLIRMVEEAQAEKANTQRFLEKAEQTYATGVVLFTVALILIPWLVFRSIVPRRILPGHDRDGSSFAVCAHHQHTRLHSLGYWLRRAPGSPFQGGRVPGSSWRESTSWRSIKRGP